MKKIFMIIILGTIFFTGCEPKRGNIEDKEAVQGDTLDPREGKGEGDVGEGVYGN